MTVEVIVSDILPTQEVHLFVGPSGAGKTTFLFQFAVDWSHGKPIFGHRSVPLPYVYISCDRSLASIKRTLKRLGITEDIPIFSAADQDDMDTINSVLNHVRKHFPDARVLFVEGLATMVESGKINDYHTVARFLTRLGRLCKKNDWTIIGVGHATKTKENERYLNPRERALGSVAWAAYAETVFLFEPVDPENSLHSKLRNIWILPRNAPDEMHEMQFDKGILIPAIKAPSTSKLKIFIGSLVPGETFTFDEAKGIASASKQYVYKTLNDMESQGLIKRIKSGLYTYTPNGESINKLLS